MEPALWHLLQTADSAFPVGGFAHSYGLEGLVQCGTVDTPSDLEEFISDTWIPSLQHVDFPLVRLSGPAAGDDTALFRLDRLAWACRPTMEARKAQQQMGRKRLDTIATISGNKRLIELNTAVSNDQWMANWPVVCGVESAVLGIDIDSCLAAYAYQSIAGILAASSKLIRIGPAEIQRILARQMPEVQAAAAASHGISESEIGWFAPMLDIAGAQHETAYSRLFIS